MDRLNSTYILDPQVFTAALKAKGFHSLSKLAHTVGLHRNTISNYLNGAPVLPDALARIFAALDLAPAEALKPSIPQRGEPALRIAKLVDLLSAAAPKCVFVLFGSRARGKEKQFSDYDLGVFREDGVDFPLYSRLLDLTAEWNDTELTSVQLVNLASAEKSFLEAIATDILFLSGSRQEWLRLLTQSGVTIYEGSEASRLA